MARNFLPTALCDGQGMAGQAGLDLLQCDWRSQVVQEELVSWEAIGVRQVCSRGWLRLLHTVAWGKGFIVAYADIKMMVEAHQQGVNTFIIRGIPHLLWMESHHRASMTPHFARPAQKVDRLHGAAQGSGYGRCAAPQHVWCSCTPRPSLSNNTTGHTLVAMGTAIITKSMSCQYW